MAGKIQKLKEDLAALENKTSLIFAELRGQYEAYLSLLGQSVTKQLILASYQLCTQYYPQRFLNLAYSQRHNLQEQLKKLGKESQEKLINCLAKAEQSVQVPSLKFLEKILSDLADMESESKPSQESLNFTEEIKSDKPTVIKDPEHLLYWCKMVEQEIIDLLIQISKDGNHILQNSQILPGQLPPQILDMAVQAEEAGQPISGHPNLLNVLVETGTKNKSEDSETEQDPSQVTKITVIHLRLVEIEFTDPNLTIQHKQIKQILDQVNQIRKQYNQKQQEYAIAEAESAWRASWVED